MAKELTTTVAIMAKRLIDEEADEGPDCGGPEAFADRALHGAFGASAFSAAGGASIEEAAAAEDERRR